MALFTHQASVIPEVLRSLRPDNPTLLVSPTGAGKTVMAAEIAMHFRRVLFVAHRIEITDQARAEMGAHVQVMSIAAALKYGPIEIDLLIIDEAHRSTAATYRKIIEKYRGCAVLGLTATPRRTDGKGLIDVFSEIVECSNTAELIAAGYLVPYRAFEAPDEALKLRDKLARMKRECGDYATRELSEAMCAPRLIGDVVREYQKHGSGRRAICFGVSVEHSKKLAEAFVAAGVRAVHVDGRSALRMRRNGLADLAAHRIDVLCNVNLFTEGWDCPAVSCVIMARPTASLTLYLQSVGRGMRPHTGKNDLLILDHAGNIDRHKAPDHSREWQLESEEQKAKREKEVAESERLAALGFDSIEAELEERKRTFADTYSGNEAALVTGIDQRALAPTLRSFGVERSFGKHNHARYSKSEVDAFVRAIRETYSVTEVQCRLGINGSISTLMRLAGINPADIRHTACRRLSSAGSRYWKSDIDQLKRTLDSTYSLREVEVLLGVSARGGRDTEWQRLIGRIRARCAKPVFGKNSGARYAKSDIDAILLKASLLMSETYSSTEARRILRLPDTVKIQKYAHRTHAEEYGRYSKASIDAIARNTDSNLTYSPEEAMSALGASRWVFLGIIKKHNLTLLGKASATRYLKTEIDALAASRANQDAPNHFSQSTGLDVPVPD